MYFRGSLLSKKVILILCTLVSIVGATKGGYKNYGMAYLVIPASAPSIASLSVFSQVAGDPGALFDNPAGTFSKELKLSFTHFFWFADVSGDNIVLSFPWKNRTVGFGVYNFRIPGIETRKLPTDEPDGIVESSYLNVTAGFSQVILRRILFGFSLKYLNEVLYDDISKGISADVGLRTDIPGDMILGLLLKNPFFYSKGKFSNAYLPRMIKVGIIRPELFVGSPFIISFGLNLISELNTEISGFQIGLKAVVFDRLQINTGFERIGEKTKKALGFGFSLEKVEVFYSLLFLPEGLGNPKILSININPELFF
ncbi:MAG: hypothetical protein DRP88_00040 [Candidatus Neomarinimicrobiota bacterium]|nr:MAG: hypothetical protein DRP88_00040 [Candidatus Neomarinimicrobiota bacterium]